MGEITGNLYPLEVEKQLSSRVIIFFVSIFFGKGYLDLYDLEDKSQKKYN